KCFKIEGVLEFSLVGILASISNIMAKADISIFAISTYNTDYILIKSKNTEKAIEELKNNHMKVVDE
ncbi:MAG: ACT domain-containing protein, partial [Bacteroidales bacterium]|nr:ACT domain-containing protein [Bacteroidales bacterium]